jgi:TPR repeat protein
MWLHTQLLRAAVLASLMLVAVGRATGAGPIDDAEAAWRGDDYSTALQLFRSLAEKGDATARTRLGQMYENGEGVPEDDAQAALWYRRAADQGSKVAQWLLGSKYQFGSRALDEATQS